MAGSGSNLALARAVGESFGAVVPPSIGTSGAVAALLDGAIDVGLASRPLRPDETALGIRQIPWATCPFGPITHGSSADWARQLMAPADLVDRLTGRTPGVVFLREPGDSGQALLRGWSADVAAALDEALQVRRWPVLTTDQEMAAAVASTPDALGFLDSSSLTPDLVLLPGSPLRKELSLLLSAAPSPRAEQFVRHAVSSAGLVVLEAAGCLPP